jgi:hypothetical protein
MCSLVLLATAGTSPAQAQGYYPPAYQQQMLLQKRQQQQALAQQQLLQKKAQQEALKQQELLKQQEVAMQKKFQNAQSEAQIAFAQALKKINAPGSLKKYGKMTEAYGTTTTTYTPFGDPIKSKVDLTVYSNYLPTKHLQFNVEFALLQRLGVEGYLRIMDRQMDYSGYRDIVEANLSAMLSQMPPQ